MTQEQTESQAPPTASQIDGLITKIDQLTDALDAHRAAVITANRRSKIATVLAVIGIVLVAAAGVVAYEARRSIETFEDVRAEARLTTCIRDNITIVGFRSAAVSGLRIFAVDQDNLTPEEQALVDEYAAAIAKDLPFRDCSEAGIRAYYENQPSDPAAG